MEDSYWSKLDSVGECDPPSTKKSKKKHDKGLIIQLILIIKQKGEDVKVEPIVPKYRVYSDTRELERTVSVLSYNILCQPYIRNNFDYTDKKYLDINYRRKNIWNQLASYKPDLLLLQEMEKTQYDKYYKSELENIGYKVLFKKRPTIKPDGICIGYQVDKYTEIEHKYIDLNKIEFVGDSIQEIRKIHKLSDEINDKELKRGNVSIITILHCNDNREVGIILCTCHLYFKMDDYLYSIQLIQIDAILNNIAFYKQKYSNYTVILGGDFNSIPNSEVYEYIKYKSSEFKFKLESSYSGYNAKDTTRSKEPTFTNFTLKFQDTLDYIFYEPMNMRVNSVLELPDKEEASKETALPNSHYPSDHLCLLINCSYIK